MADPNEIEALKASMRGVMSSADALRTLADRVQALDPLVDPDEGMLDDLHRLSAAHALAAQALRGLVETMLKRRGRAEDVAATETRDEE